MKKVVNKGDLNSKKQTGGKEGKMRGEKKDKERFRSEGGKQTYFKEIKLGSKYDKSRISSDKDQKENISKKVKKLKEDTCE